MNASRSFGGSSSSFGTKSNSRSLSKTTSRASDSVTRSKKIPRELLDEARVLAASSSGASQQDPQLVEVVPDLVRRARLQIDLSFRRNACSKSGVPSIAERSTCRVSVARKIMS